MARLRSAIALLLFHSGRMADRISRTTWYLAAGTRRLAEMRADHRRAWDAYYERHSVHESGLLSWEEDCLGRFATPGARVLVVGCGSGRDLMALVERGCEVTGMDPSGTGLEVADRLLRADRGVFRGHTDRAAVRRRHLFVLLLRRNPDAVPAHRSVEESCGARGCRRSRDRQPRRGHTTTTPDPRSRGTDRRRACAVRLAARGRRFRLRQSGARRLVFVLARLRGR